jgi:alpha-methylacyl-CoA racemase
MFYEMIGAGQHDEHGRGTNILDGGSPFYDVYETADGQWIAVGAVEPQFYLQLVEVLGLDETARVQQWDKANWPQLRESFQTAFRTRTRQEWSEILAGRDVCATPVLRPSECRRHPHHCERRAFVDVGGVAQPAPTPKLSRTPAAVRHAGVPTEVDQLLEEWEKPTPVSP